MVHLCYTLSGNINFLLALMILIYIIMRFSKLNPRSQHTVEAGSRQTVKNNCPNTGNISLLDSANSKISFSFFFFPRILNSCHSIQITGRQSHSCLMMKIVSYNAKPMIPPHWHCNFLGCFPLAKQNYQKLLWLFQWLKNCCSRSFTPCIIKFCISDSVDDLTVLFNPCGCISW